MESMDYNYYANTPHPYQYMGYGDAALLHNNNNNNHHQQQQQHPHHQHHHQKVGSATQTLDHDLDAGALMSGIFDYAFDTQINHANGMTPLPTTSASPPSQQMLLLPNGSVDSGIALDMEGDPRGRRSSSEEKDNLTPAQSRRKAQNRAAQRAFRERKERHVRDLEAKLSLLTTTTSSLQSDNERLKLLLQRAQTENEILRATAASSPSSLSNGNSFPDDLNFLAQTRLNKKGTGFDEDLLLDQAGLSSGIPISGSSSPKTGLSSEGSTHLLSASATWDFLQSHPLYLSGAVDIGEVCERLKKLAKCEGMGPVFEEEDVRKLIEDVGRSGSAEVV